MSALSGRNSIDFTSQMAQVQEAASRLLNRLAARAAYASEEEYREIRSLMAALRGLSSPPSDPQ